MNKFCKKLMQFLFSYVGLTLILVAYSALGAFIFTALEAPAEKKVEESLMEISNNIEKHRELIKHKIFELASKFEERTYNCKFFWEDELGDLYMTDMHTKNFTVIGEEHPYCWNWQHLSCVPESCVHVCIPKSQGGLYDEYDPELCENKVASVVQAKIRDLIEEYHNHLKLAITAFDYSGKVTTVTYEWSFASAMLYTITCMSTIGYGHIEVTSDFGRIMVLLYSVVGIPLFLLFMSSIGAALAAAVKFLHQSVICYTCNRRRDNTEKRYEIARDGSLIKKGSVDRTQVVEEEDTMLNLNDFVGGIPLSLIAFVIIAYMAIGSFYFSHTEDWTFMQSFYFCFVSFTTIGFGEFIPGLGQKDINTMTGSLKLFSGVIFVMGGLAVLGMGIDLLAYELSRKYKTVGTKVGAYDETVFDEDGDGIDDDAERFNRGMQVLA